MVHTAEVTALALNMAKPFSSVSYDVLTVAAVLHDFMKIREYEYSAATDKIEKTSYRKLVRHLAGSHAMFCTLTSRFTEEEIPDSVRLAIEHAMLAHHGRLEWQTAVEPITTEAHILHYADMLSSRFGADSPDQLETTVIPEVSVNTWGKEV